MGLTLGWSLAIPDYQLPGSHDNDKGQVVIPPEYHPVQVKPAHQDFRLVQAGLGLLFGGAGVASLVFKRSKPIPYVRLTLGLFFIVMGALLLVTALASPGDEHLGTSPLLNPPPVK